MVRRHTALRGSLVAAAVVLVAGCSQDPAGLPTSVDYERAQQAWSEPWLAPDEAAVPEAAWGSPDGYVRRDAGTRTTSYTSGTTKQALRTELAAAAAAGWRVTGSLCDAPAAALAKGDGLADGMAATVTAEQLDPEIRVTVTAYVPHHLDQDWPALPASDQTCVREAGVADLVAELRAGAPFGGVEDPAEPETTTWQRDERSDGDRALLDAVSEDPWVTGYDLTFGSEMAADDALRRGPVQSVTVPHRSLAETVTAMTDWDLTWVSCGRDRAAEASLRLVTDHGVAVARLSQVPGTRTDVTVTLPIPETPPPVWITEVPVLEDPPCLATAPRGRRVWVEGTPVALVTESQPVAE